MALMRNMTPRAAVAVEDLLFLVDNASAVNGSLINATLAIPRYPSGYTLPQIVVASIVVTLIMVAVVVGNMLVIIAITTEKALKNIQNWFIASLAVADFFLGLIIMPFSLANELMGYWIFGVWWCDIHSAMDVLLSTASIMNLCLISLDRYWSITQAVEYLKKRTPGRAVVMIAAVWVLSALICIPPLLGWKVESAPEEQYPKCQLSEELGYVLYSALGSFYIPSCIMVFVYIRIYYAAKARARRGIRKPPRRPPQDAQTSFTTSMPSSKNGAGGAGGIGDTTAGGSVDRNSNTSPRDGERQIATIEALPQPIAIPTVTCELASDISTSDAGELAAEGMEQKDTLQVVGLARRVERIIALAERLNGNSPPTPSPSAATARGRLYAFKADVSVEQDILKAFKWTHEELGPVHILVNNAGVLQDTNLIDGDANKWKAVFDTNVLGLCMASREAVKSMRAGNVHGHIIHVNSISGHIVDYSRHLNVYAASKHAVTALTETMRQELNSIASKIKITVFGSAPVAPTGQRASMAACQFRGSTLSVNGELQQQAAALARARQPSMGIDADMVSEFDPSSSDSGVVSRCAVVKPLKLRLCKPIFGRRTNKVRRGANGKDKTDNKVLSASSPRDHHHHHHVHEEMVVPRVQKPRDPEREKRRLARKKEKRATLILGLIMGSFIACWLPFFFMYILRLAYDIPGITFSTAFWLGYMNSALNPVIYTIFNKDFRRAFRRILFK